MSPSTVSHSRQFRPLRWIGMCAVACFVAYVYGAASATPAVPAPPAACTAP